MSRYLASFPMASSTSWKQTNHQKNQQKATTDPTATARRSVADWKNSSGPKLEGQPRRSAAERKPKTSLFGTDSLQCSALGIHADRTPAAFKRGAEDDWGFKGRKHRSNEDVRIKS